jgi:ferritin-like metal-binding protein YciE
MAKAAHSEELKAAFEKHHGETEGHIVRLDRVFASINQKPQGKTCAAIVGTDEGTEIMVEYKGRLRSTPVFSPPRRPLTTKCLDTARFVPGPNSWVWRRPRLCLKRRWKRKTDEALTKIAESVVNQEAQSVAAE